jgi:hypothetical protein
LAAFRRMGSIGPSGFETAQERLLTTGGRLSEI